MRDRAMLTMTRTEAIPYASMKAGMPWDWVTYPEFLDSVDRRPKGVNLLPFVPMAPLMVWVMGLEDAKSGRMPTETENDRDEAASSTRRWIMAHADGRRSASVRTAFRPISTARRWSPT